MVLTEKPVAILIFLFKKILNIKGDIHLFIYKIGRLGIDNVGFHQIAVSLRTIKNNQ